MSEPNRARGPWCGVCEVERRAGNHWFKFVATDDSFTVVPIDSDVVGVPVCGPGCATKRLSQWTFEKIEEATRGLDNQADGEK
jgi:hypothetical protein